jgi:hypothetical protein
MDKTDQIRKIAEQIYYWSTMPDGKKIVNQEAKQMLHELSWKLVNITRNE